MVSLFPSSSIRLLFVGPGRSKPLLDGPVLSAKLSGPNYVQKRLCPNQYVVHEKGNPIVLPVYGCFLTVITVTESSDWSPCSTLPKQENQKTFPTDAFRDVVLSCFECTLLLLSRRLLAVGAVLCELPPTTARRARRASK